MQVNDKILVQELTVLFKNQLGRYREMRDLVRKILSRVILSRGDLSGVVASLEKKKKLLEEIGMQQRNGSELILQWQMRKNSIREDSAVAAMNSVLDQIEIIIREFLDEEEQLRKYIENNIQKECGSAVS